jgi:DNA-binding NtrC family response regulator
MQRSIQADGNLNALSSQLSPSQIEDIINCCLPRAKRRPDARERDHAPRGADGWILGSSKSPLQLATLNDRLVVSGGAGTGKTLIAMEVARRAAERGDARLYCASIK